MPPPTQRRENIYLPFVGGSNHDSSETDAVHMVDRVEALVVEEHPDHLHVPVLANCPVQGGPALVILGRVS